KRTNPEIVVNRNLLRGILTVLSTGIFKVGLRAALVLMERVTQPPLPIAGGSNPFFELSQGKLGAVNRSCFCAPLDLSRNTIRFQISRRTTSAGILRIAATLGGGNRDLPVRSRCSSIQHGKQLPRVSDLDCVGRRRRGCLRAG